MSEENPFEPLPGEQQMLEEYARLKESGEIDQLEAAREERKKDRSGSTPRIKGPDFTDAGNAARFRREHHGKCLYDHKRSQWLLWDGTRFREDERRGIFKLAYSTILGMMIEADNEENDRARSEKKRRAISFASERGLASMLKLASTQSDEYNLAIITPQLDAEPYYLNTYSGVIDLRTFSLIPSSPLHLCSKIAPIIFDEDAICPNWEDGLGMWFNGNQELIDFVQRAVGLSLVGETLEHAVFFLHGSGANGKSSFINCIRGILGDYFQTVPTSVLMYSERDAVPNDVAALQGVRFAVCHELPRGRRFNESTVKLLTGGDELRARFLHRESFSFNPSHSLWMLGNHRPAVRDVSEGFWRRMLLVPFMVEIRKSCQVAWPELWGRYENESSGIFNWMLTGLKNYRQRGLAAPSEVLSATQEYRQEQDEIGQFIDEQCTVKTGASVTMPDFMRRYKTWAETNGRQAMSGKAVHAILRSKGFECRTGHGRTTIWHSLAIAEDGKTNDGEDGELSPVIAI